MQTRGSKKDSLFYADKLRTIKIPISYVTIPPFAKFEIAFEMKLARARWDEYDILQS